MPKPYMALYHDYLNALEPLDDAERGRLITACLLYSKSGTVMELAGNERYLFPMLRAAIDRDKIAYEEKCRENAENGKRGGRPKKVTDLEENQTVLKKANGFKKSHKEEKEEYKDKEEKTLSPHSPPSGAVGVSWKKDFELYRSIEKSAYEALLTDAEWINKRERYHPKLDIRLTLEKSHLDFWSTEAGWQNKKQKRCATIDWRRTFANAVDQRMNWVYKPRSADNYQQEAAAARAEAEKERRLRDRQELLKERERMKKEAATPEEVNKFFKEMSEKFSIPPPPAPRLVHPGGVKKFKRVRSGDRKGTFPHKNSVF